MVRLLIYSNSEMSGHEQIRFLSPPTLSTRETYGQNLFSLIYSAGYAALFLEYGLSQLSPQIIEAV